MRPELPAAARDEGEGDQFEYRARRVAIILVIAFVVLQPAYALVTTTMTGLAWFQLVAALVVTAIVLRRVIFSDIRAPRLRFRDQQFYGLDLLVVLGLALALLVTGGPNWLTTVAVASAMVARFSRTPRPAVAGALACVITGLVLASKHNYGEGGTFSLVLVPLLSALFAYSAAQRGEVVDQLRRTRAELARAAVAEERLRIARDLHDLLGHSLSLITLKAELAGRVMATNPERAALEVAELETVARQSLSDVREAVAGFRQPDLAGELAAARQLLDAAGIASTIISADADNMPQKVDAALAWTVREGTTNIVRHSRATEVQIRVTAGPASVTAEISDNGPAAPGQISAQRPPTTGPDGRVLASRPAPPFAGSGLAGLAERIRILGGELAAGTVEPQGFLLRVIVPFSPPAT